MAEMKGPGCIWRIWSAAARQGARQDLPRRPSRSRPSICRLPIISTANMHRSNYPALSYNLADVHSQRPESVPADPLSEIVQDRGRQGLGQLLPFQLHDLSGRNRAAHLQRGTGRPTRRSSSRPCEQFLAKQLGSDPAGKRAGQKTVCRSRLTWRRARRPAWPSSTDPQAITALWVKTQVRQSRRRDGRPPQAGPADHLGRPVEAGRVVPAGRFLRHRAGREPLQDAADRHDQAGLLFLLVHAVWRTAPWWSWSTRTQ